MKQSTNEQWLQHLKSINDPALSLAIALIGEQSLRHIMNQMYSLIKGGLSYDKIKDRITLKRPIPGLLIEALYIAQTNTRISMLKSSNNPTDKLKAIAYQNDLDQEFSNRGSK